MHCGEVICLADSASTHTILQERKYFTNFIPIKTSVKTISGESNLVEGHGKARIMLSNDTELVINEALYSPRSRRTLLSFKDIRTNGFHVETTEEKGIEYLCITSNLYGQKRTLEKLKCLSNGLYMTTIRSIETNLTVSQKLTNMSNYLLWHDRLGHPGQTMMRRILNSSKGHHLQNKDLVYSNTLCQACSLGKLNTRPSYAQASKDSIPFL